MAKATVRALICCVLAAATVAPAVHAVETGHKIFKLLKIERQPAKWYSAKRDAPVELTYAFIDRRMAFKSARNCTAMQAIGAALKPSSISLDAFRSETEKAFQLWENVAEVRFSETSDVETANILIGAQIAPRGRAFTNVALDAGKKHMTPRAISRSLVCFNPAVPWKVGYDGDLDVYDLSYTMAHEIGHALGLDHPGPSGQLMGYRYDEQHNSLQVGDIDGILQLYKPTRDAAQIRQRAEYKADRRLEQKNANAGGIPNRPASSSMGLGDGALGR